MEKTGIIRRQFMCNDLHVREAGEGEAPSRTITGYAVLFNTPSDPLWDDEDGEAREVIAPEAITREFLDEQDIKMTMFHDRQLILARSKNGEGTLSYDVDAKGVKFEFDAPRTADGDKALELVRRGDIAGCSFAFTTRYFDDECVSRSVSISGGKTNTTYTVKAITGVYDFTLAADPAYPDTSVEAREFVGALKGRKEEDKDFEIREKVRKQVRELRRAAEQTIY